VQLHGCTVAEVEYVVNHPTRGYPVRDGEKRRVHGRGQGDRFVQVVYVIDPDGTIFVIDAMPLSGGRRRRGR
jgi:hypothetical protein